MGRDTRVEVELVGPDPHREPVTSSGDGDDGDAPARPSAQRRRRWLFVLAAASVAGALLVTQGVLDARERARIARFAEVDGVLPVMDETIDVLWTMDDRAASLLNADGASDGLLVGAWYEPSGAQTAAALDVRTGEVVWSTPLSGAEEIMAGFGALWIPCVTGVDEAAPTLACVVLTAHAPGPDPALAEQGPAPVPGAAELVVLDARTGEIVRREPATVDLHVAALGDTLVTAWPETDGSITVRAVGARTGSERWRFTAPAHEAGTPTEERPAVVLGAWPRTAGVLVQTPLTAWRLSPDGEVVATIHPRTDGDEYWFLEPTRDGGVSLLTWSPETTTTTLLDATGDPTSTLPGRAIWPSVDDGSAPGTLLVSTGNGSPSAWDTRRGDVPWVNDELGSGERAGGVVLDGVYYTSGSRDTLVAVDLVTGETLWRASAPDDDRDFGVAASSVLTDGRAILAVLRRGSSATVEAYARTDGAHLWTAALPAGITTLTVRGGVLVGWSDDGTRQVVLG